MDILPSRRCGANARSNYSLWDFAPERIQYGIDRYLNETKRLFSVFETKLEDHDFITTDQISITDIVLFPWVHRLDRVPEVQKGLDVPQSNSYRIVRSDSVKVK
ncbi:hypothetical protein CONCODRAFT_4019 [Conidiobolus coronatus NRRL 28638]|uniref:GST C-terminal domain-containing protein n=1 Tax=Conidiobolus coronatus (strain ATCC 28846 / CBS 209.66 / NRRL 28638) TaxID=796925 RepID=A0A137PDR6_CONC2|nr:hypothetical protein CONCODRAFT_4019 [Conidiobolus coronatus NRRL 28638]|eukprot:KXN73130.1 hypothetical protein CONCODRAFT_4019 [Conidiobolus coronatus NRRL 28638]